MKTHHLLLIAGLLAPQLCQANVGIPVVAIGLPLLLVNLVFVVGIETWVLLKRHTELSKRETLKHVFLANLVTTLLGYPIVGILVALLVFIGFNGGWLFPFENLAEMRIYVSNAVVVTLVPCFFLSVWVEGRWLKRMLSNEIRWRDCYSLHLASYAFLLIQVYAQFPIKLLTYAQGVVEPTYQAMNGIARLFFY